MKQCIRTVLSTIFVSATLVACGSGAPSLDVVHKVIQGWGPSDRTLKVANLQYHCKITRGPDGHKLPHAFYAYTADVQAIKDGEPLSPPAEMGFLFFQKANGGPWDAAGMSRDGWNCE